VEAEERPRKNVCPAQRPTPDLDTVASVAFSMYEEYKEPLYAAPPLLQRMVDAGRLGRKSGSGFYTYG
jgi:3-hydroxybutyryl-CoA dehydrogenase